MTLQDFAWLVGQGNDLMIGSLHFLSVLLFYIGVVCCVVIDVVLDVQVAQFRVVVADIKSA